MMICILQLSGIAKAQTDNPVATVNGEAISASEFFERVQRVTARDFILSINPLTIRNLTGGQLLMDQMINERLTLQWATKTNQLPSDTDVNTEVEKSKTQPQIQQALATHLFSDEFLKNSIRYQRARFNLATTAVSVSPDEVEKYYKAHLLTYTTPERYTVEGLNTTKQTDIAKVQADLKAGKPFRDLVKAYCEDSAIKARNGSMGTLVANDQNIPAPIREAVAVLKDGQTSPPVKIEADPGGGKPKVAIWWFLHMVHREPAAAQPFPVVKPQVEQAALLERAGGLQVADKKIADFRQLSDIKISLPGYEMLLPRTKKP